MLEVRDEEYLVEVRAYADKIGLREDLEKSLKYLDEYGECDGEGNRDKGKTKCYLGKDFAPYSFTFLLQKRNGNGEYVNMFNGGLIFHGPHDNGGDGSYPTLSVSLSPGHGWQVHT